MDQNSDENPYRSPQASLVQPEVGGEELASRVTRLVAVLLDAIIGFAVFGPVAYFGGYFDQVRANTLAGRMFLPLEVIALWTAIGFAGFVLIQAYPLHAYGQTWGKRICKIKIVDMAGAKPSLGRLLCARYLPVNVVAAIPVIGSLLGMLDILMIFRADKRCLHDLVAGTRVVEAR